MFYEVFFIDHHFKTFKQTVTINITWRYIYIYEFTPPSFFQNLSFNKSDSCVCHHLCFLQPGNIHLWELWSLKRVFHWPEVTWIILFIVSTMLRDSIALCPFTLTHSSDKVPLWSQLHKLVKKLDMLGTHPKSLKCWHMTLANLFS